MSLELLPPDRLPDPEEEDTRLGERLEKIGNLVEGLKEDLIAVHGILEALLDYLGIDRLELEFFRQTGELRAYPRRMATLLQAARQAGQHHDSLEEKLAKREDDINEAVKRLDEVIAGIKEFDADCESC